MPLESRAARVVLLAICTQPPLRKSISSALVLHLSIVDVQRCSFKMPSSPNLSTAPRVPVPQHVPVELWRDILRYFIAEEELFDPCRVENRNATSVEQVRTLDLWRSIEKRRKVLRVVCRSWKVFVDKHLGRLIGWNGSDQGWTMQEQHTVRVAVCRRWHRSFFHMLRANPKGFPSLTALHLVQGLPAKGWDCDLEDTAQLLENLSTLPKLQLLHIRGHVFDLSDIATHLPHLISLSVARDFPSSTNRPWSFSHLQILDCSVVDNTFTRCQLPSLRHFSVARILPIEPLCTFLEHNGAHMQSLRLGNTGTTAHLPPEVWLSIPKIQFLHANLFNTSIPPLPLPRDHIVKIVHTHWKSDSGQSIPLVWALGTSGTSPYVSCLEFSFEFHITWKEIVELNELHPSDHARTSLIRWATVCDRAGFYLRDRKGMSLADGRCFMRFFLLRILFD